MAALFFGCLSNGRLCDIMKNGVSLVKNSHLTSHFFYALQRANISIM